MNLFFDTFSTPLGDFSVAVNDAGAVSATAFGDRAALLARLRRVRNFRLQRDALRTRHVQQQVREYFSGERREFALTLAPTGTDFQLLVWSALQTIPYGTLQTYGRLASALKRGGSARAVGRANATNPVCLIIPCHRVVGHDGALTGFAFGEAIKRRLLEHEGAPGYLARAVHAA